MSLIMYWLSVNLKYRFRHNSSYLLVSHSHESDDVTACFE